MIPLTDASRRPVRFPAVTVALILANILAFVWELGSSEADIIRLATVPAHRRTTGAMGLDQAALAHGASSN